jgi:hypothetical protein
LHITEERIRAAKSGRESCPRFLTASGPELKSIDTTVIMFWVRVPVLSLASIDMDPNESIYNKQRNELLSFEE